MVLLYLKGIAIMILMVGYPIIFNMLWKKFTKDDLMDNNYGVIGAFVLPYVLLVATLMLLAIPLVFANVFGVELI